MNSSRRASSSVVIVGFTAPVRANIRTASSPFTSIVFVGVTFEADNKDDDDEEEEEEEDDEEEGGVGDDGNCHPSYSPCVPYAYDVDCASGKGN